MIIYRKIIFNSKMEEVYSEKERYNGELSICKGGGSTTTNTQDPVYNARMASIAEQELGMAKSYFDVWDTGGGKAMDMEQIAANRELIPLQADVAKQETWLAGETADAKRQLLPMQTDLEKQKITANAELLPWQTGNAKTAMAGAQSLMSQAADVNTNDYMGQYQADAAQGFEGAETQLKRNMAMQGWSPGSAQYQKALQTLNFNKAKTVGGARTLGRRAADTERFNRTGAATTAATNLMR